MERTENLLEESKNLYKLVVDRILRISENNKLFAGSLKSKETVFSYTKSKPLKHEKEAKDLENKY